MFKEHNDPFRFTLMVVDLFASAVSFALAFYLRFFFFAAHNFDFSTLALEDYALLACVLSGNQVISFVLVNLYHPRRTRSFIDEIGSVLSGIALNVLLTLAILFFLKAQDLSRFIIILFAVVNVFVIAFSHSIVRNILRLRRLKGINVQPVVVLGTSSAAQRIARSLVRDPLFGFKIAGFVRERAGDTETTLDILGDLANLEDILRQTKARIVVCALDDAGRATIGRILEICDREGVNLKLIPGFSDFIAIHGKIDNIDGLPVVSVRDIPAREGINRILKRSLDLLFSLLFVTVFSPVYLLAAIMVKLTSPGPVFFAQERIGLDGKTFRMLKFRTMRTQATQKSDTIWTTKDDPRVTAIGRFMRKTSIDEIPQFFNVLSGRMSIVGPRPERPFFVEQFRDRYDLYMRRHAVKAGITGWAQVNGLRGDTSIEERVLADIYYIENWSIWLDLRIIFMTPFKGLINKNAY